VRFYGEIVQIYLSGRMGGEMERRTRQWNVAGTLLNTRTCIYEKLYHHHHHHQNFLYYRIHLPLEIHFICMYALS